MGLDRGISAQAIYLINAPLDATTRTLLAFDSSRHPELGTLQHHIFQDQTGAEFDKLRLDTRQSACASLAEAARDARRIQLSRAEAAHIPRDRSPDSVRRFLSSILQQRWIAFLKPGDLGSVRTFDTRSEVRSLLGEEPKIAGHFSGLLAPLLKKSGTDTPKSHYWDLSEVNGTGAIALGALYLTNAEPRRQILDLTYFSSGGYLVSMSLYEFVPVTVNGRPATLAWQGCLVSSTELSGGFGIKRQIAARVMIGDLEKSIRAFRKDAEKAAR